MPHERHSKRSGTPSTIGSRRVPRAAVEIVSRRKASPPGYSSLEDPVDAVFEPLFGSPCWQIANFHGSMLMIEFGNPTVQIEEAVIRPTPLPDRQGGALRRRVTVLGEWTLTIEQCQWGIEAEGSPPGRQ